VEDLIRILILGTGQMGAGIARAVIGKRGLQLVSACDRRRDFAGCDLGHTIGLERNLDIGIDSSLAAAIEKSRPHLAIQASCSMLEDAWPDIATLLRAGVNVISIAEEMAYPACRSPDLAAEIEQTAVANGVRVLGTGVNPGFVLDLLVILLTGVCTEVESITAERRNDLAPFGPAVLTTQGVGLSAERFASGVADGTITGHIGFPQSMHMIARAVGWTIDHIEESREAIVSKVRRETPFVTVEPGQVAGCRHQAVAYGGGKALITLIHPQQIHPQLEGQETGDRITITGQPSLSLAGSPEIPGADATAGVAVNMIPRVLNAPPGLYAMSDLPVPAALLADVRGFVHSIARQDDV
jgi:4-hydroxy-tetrahydrodipicolinate reductase